MTEVPRKILVVALDNLGDAVMASAVLTPLKKSFPSAFVGLWAKEYTAGLFDGHPALDRVHAADPFWDTSPGVPPGGFAHFYSTIQAIRHENYDTALLLNTEWRRALAARLAGIGRRVGYDRRHSRIFLTRALPVASGVRHFVDDHRALLEQGLGVAPDAEPFSRLAVTAREQMEFEQWRVLSGVAAKKYWVAHLFSGDPLKNWPIARWIELMDRLEREPSGQRCVVLLGPSEDKKLSTEQRADLQKRALFVIAPPLGLLKTVLSNASVVVDGDSGPGHVAAALGTPLVSLFGPTNPARSRPVGPGATRTVSALAVADIAVDDVLRAMKDLGRV
jgi:ADP-heptose:LPS heptosyltransferase